MRQTGIALACLLVVACAKPDPHADLRKLIGFHRQLIAIDRQVTAASDAYTRASSAALNANDNRALFRAAQDLRAAMAGLAPLAAQTGVPDLSSGDAAGHARSALGSLSAQIDAREDVADSVQLLSDPDTPHPDAIAAVAAAGDQANAAVIAESSEMVLAYGALGVTPDRIDSRRGGLLGK